MISRRNFLVKSITSLVCLAISGCAKGRELSSRLNVDSGFKLSDSPNFNKSTKRFQHPSGDLNEKSFSDLFNFSRDYFMRVDDEWENTGFPVAQISENTLQKFKENVMWVGHSSVIINHSNLTILTDPQFSDYASPFPFMGPRRATPAPLNPLNCRRLMSLLSAIIIMIIWMNTASGRYPSINQM